MEDMIMITEAEAETLKNVVNALDHDQALIVASALPIEILYEAFSDKVAELNDFVDEVAKLRNHSIFRR